MIQLEILAPKGALDETRRAMCERFAQGLAAYRGKDFDGAIAHFQGALALVPDGGPSRVFLERSREYKSTPPQDDWDGVHDLDAK